MIFLLVFSALLYDFVASSRLRTLLGVQNESSRIRVILSDTLLKTRDFCSHETIVS